MLTSPRQIGAHTCTRRSHSAGASVDPAANARGYYRIAWEPTLLDDHAVIRSYGRKGAWQRTCITPFPSFEAAWPLIRASLKTRLRHGYRVVGST
jgi:predicted DNA-binding WGR domain protein